MSRKALLLLAIGAFTTRAFAAPAFFDRCASALETEPLAPLRAYLAAAPLGEMSLCMRLSNREFLVTANPHGAYNHNLFYCDLRGAPTTCIEDRSGAYYPNLELEREFTGAHGKRYALWSTSRLRRGIVSTGYFIFHLVPRTEAPRGYLFYSLHVGTAKSYTEGPGEDVCSRLGASEEAIDVTGFSLVGEGSGRVSLHFPAAVTDCATKTVERRIIRLELVNGRFTPARE